MTTNSTDMSIERLSSARSALARIIALTGPDPGLIAAYDRLDSATRDAERAATRFAEIVGTVTTQPTRKPG